jgi:hypothetical protein
VNRVFTNEGVGRFDGQFRGAALVVGVHQVELNLARNVTERVARLDNLEYLDATTVIAVLDRRLCLLVGILQVLCCVESLVIAGTGG